MSQTVCVWELMSHPVASTDPEARLSDAGRIMRELHVSGLPVLDTEGHVVGVVSEKDLVQALDLSAGISSLRGLLDLLFEVAPPGEPTMFEGCRQRLDNARVKDAMTSPAITVSPSTTATEAALRMVRDQIHRLPIIDRQGQLIGIVTRADLILGSLPEKERNRPRSLQPSPSQPAETASEPFSDA